MSDGHVLQVHESGAADGCPALLLHGGPGSGGSALLRSHFDPARYRLIGFDQRGAGASTPRGGLRANDTPHLLADLRALRAHLGIERWLVVGGSWGATLAIAHAHDAPEAVSGLLLRAVFLARDEDLQWFFQDASSLQPAAWSEFAGCARVEQRHALLSWLARRFVRGPRPRCRSLALAWWRWEQTLAHGAAPEADSAPAGAALDALVDRYRVQSHYLAHRCWLDAPALLERCTALPRVPTLLLHGDADRVCRPEGARAVHAAIAGSRLQWVAGAGHAPTHPGMAAAMRAALDGYGPDRGFVIGA